ncbi:hypothetical protein PAXRUDRAFT_766242 [Paxillus rubicundulus Ve08.2h10]|uniref:Uncharacterized protein n=1 Tax=Paxillus rubicundulus Ve08.2h10 TaxID=930991 RepID=A0A0D0CBS5_9AGAM|nr:hypothetical protein PAXRUDRAFT_766242 [Paxillus rubicundulus Ve08.2h10]
MLEVLQFTNTMATQFLLYILTLEQYHHHLIVLDLLSNAHDILFTFNKHPLSHSTNSVTEIATVEYAREVCFLSAEENGLHFNVSHTSLTQLEKFSVEDVVKTMHACTLQLWRLLDVILAAQWQLDKDGNQHMGDGDDKDTHWLELGEDELGGINLGSGGSDTTSSEGKKAARQKSMLVVVSEAPWHLSLAWD